MSYVRTCRETQCHWITLTPGKNNEAKTKKKKTKKNNDIGTFSGSITFKSEETINNGHSLAHS